MAVLFKKNRIICLAIWSISHFPRHLAPFMVMVHTSGIASDSHHIFFRRQAKFLSATQIMRMEFLQKSTPIQTFLLLFLPLLGISDEIWQ